MTVFACFNYVLTYFARASSCDHTNSLKRSASAVDLKPSARWCAELVWSYSRVKYSRGRPMPARGKEVRVVSNCAWTASHAPAPPLVGG